MSAMQLGRVWASTPVNPNMDPGSDKWKLGWVAEIPVFQMLNFINNRYDTNIVSLAERGVFEWGPDLDYRVSALVWDETDGSIYISKVASPSALLRPSLNLTQWDKSSVQISRAQYDSAVANWSNHIANTSNPHQLTVDILNTYSKTIIDQKVLVVQTGLNTHTGNTTNIHDVTAAQVGAVPVTGGSYTGLVRHLFASVGIGAASFAAKLITDVTGTFLAQGANAKIGLDNSNKAVFVDDFGVKSNLLIESNYIAAREVVEATYVPPTPDCEVMLRNSLNVFYGAGAVTFTGPAGSRGYLDKSGSAKTAALNAPRFTVKGLYVTNNIDQETLTLPTALNILNATDYTWALGFQSLSTTGYIAYVPTGDTGKTTSIQATEGYYVFWSVIGDTAVAYNIAPVNHSIPHKIVIVSSAVLNQTFVYFDGALSLTITGKQDYVSGASFVFSNAGASQSGPVYLNSFRTWLSALTPRQVSNL